ncbi:ATP-binding cassette subfamily B protein [Paraburkholderia silvatlantica]|uniref:ATP-binding cassette subfamily B protein n=1 Tax=Paraburkholderia silvatlantica TaxID=321895 RepID=A0A2V4TNR4_9BURK|nr:ABC transporter ATP-binding protein [Paraburkholderia silvatlantica]PYE25451.1 ATP-binding cassette subfamily B protein [Paraburkholderia silvatlantica]
MEPVHGRTETSPKVSNAEVLTFIWSFWKRRPRSFAFAGALTLLWTGLDLSLPLASSHLITAVSSQPFRIADAWGAWRLYIVLFAAYAVTRNVTFRLWARIAALNMEALLNDAFRRLQAAPVEWHGSQGSGTTIRRVIRAMWGYDSVTDAVTIWFAPSSVVLVGLCTALAWRELTAGLVAFATVSGFLIASALLTVRYVRPANLYSNQCDAHLSGSLADALDANSVIKSFATELRERQHIADAAATWRRAILVTWGRFIDIGLIQNACLLLLLAGISAAMLHAWDHAHADAGDIAFAITSFLVMSGYLRNVGENVRQLQRGLDDTSDAVALRHLQTEEVDAPSGNFALTGGTIVFDNVSFAYPNAKHAACSNTSFTVACGEIVALMGPSGTGKSTLIKLMQRMYELQSGKILIGGRDTTRIPLHALRRSIAVAPQQPDLFHRSVRENIAYGRPDASLTEIIEAARVAQADRFINELSEGYDTLVGERGAKLSGGQRQRVAIARALLAEAPIVVLDESTSALDPKTEEAILARLRSYLRGRTCVFITHRPSAAQFADRIVHIADGRIESIESMPPVSAQTTPPFAMRGATDAA